MKALTIWQPWASLIVAGLKRYEFRRYPAPRSLVGYRFVIHAGKRRPTPAELTELRDSRERLVGSCGPGVNVDAAIALIEGAFADAESLPYSAGLGTAILGVPVKAIDEFRVDAGDLDVDPDIWAWPLGAREQWADPIAAAGAQGFWNWDTPSTGSGHTCHARGCSAEVPPRMLMCGRHWRMVPRALQREVWATYRPGQERDKNPTADYLIAAQAAIDAVTALERPKQGQLAMTEPRLPTETCANCEHWRGHALQTYSRCEDPRKAEREDGTDLTSYAATCVNFNAKARP